MPIQKGTMPPRYDEAFKAGAVKMVTGQGRSVKEIVELGICINTLRSWLKCADFHPSSLTRQNREDARRRELEAEIRALHKHLAKAEKNKVIAVLTNGGISDSCNRLHRLMKKYNIPNLISAALEWQ